MLDCFINVLPFDDIIKMKRFYYVAIASGVGIAAIVILITQFNIFSVEQNKQGSGQIGYLDFSYEEANSDLKSILMSQHINMSNPLKFSSQADIDKYCNFLSDTKKQSLVKYCTSAELRDSSGFIGDINMVGSTDAPGLVIVALQTDPFLANYDEVKTIFNDVLNETVCKCWNEEKPGGYSTLSAMTDGLRDFHMSGKKPDSTTGSIPLANKHFEIELTTNENGYLWKLLIAR